MLNCKWPDLLLYSAKQIQVLNLRKLECKFILKPLKTFYETNKKPKF